jgi:hypothetical protein
MLALSAFWEASRCFGHRDSAAYLWLEWPETYQADAEVDLDAPRSVADGWARMRSSFGDVDSDAMRAAREFVIAAPPSIAPASKRVAIICPPGPPVPAPKTLPAGKRALERLNGYLTEAVDTMTTFVSRTLGYCQLAAAEDGFVGQPELAQIADLANNQRDAEDRCSLEVGRYTDFVALTALQKERRTVASELARLSQESATDAGEQQVLRARVLREYTRVAKIVQRIQGHYARLRDRVDNALEEIDNREAALLHQVTPAAAATDEESGRVDGVKPGQPLPQLPASEPVGDQKPPVANPRLSGPHESRPEGKRVEGERPSSPATEPPVDDPAMLPDYLFRKKGKQWNIRFAGGEMFSMNDLVGLHYIAYLLQHRKEQIPISRLRETYLAQKGAAEARPTTRTVSLMRWPAH